MLGEKRRGSKARRDGESRDLSLEVVYDYDSPLHISGSTWRSGCTREGARLDNSLARIHQREKADLSHTHTRSVAYTILRRVSVKAFETAVRDLTRL